MNIRKNIIVEGKHGKPVWFDAYYLNDNKKKPVVIFAHGFKGFKDWGHWHLFAAGFAQAGFLCLKLNFSHNGTTPDGPEDFDDLEAYGQNNYTKELSDLDILIDWVLSEKNLPHLELDRSGVSLIGHSRGGGVCIVKSVADSRVKKLILWASVSSLAFAWEDNPELVEKWRTDGVFHIMNGRTKQLMPLYFQLYEDYQQNEALYNVKNACEKLNLPTLILQGDNDPAIPVTAAKKLNDWVKDSRLEVIEGANHVFGGKHPYREISLPRHSQALFEYTLAFLK